MKILLKINEILWQTIYQLILIFLNKVFLEHKDFYSVHLKNYDYIIFKYLDLKIFSLLDLSYNIINNCYIWKKYWEKINFIPFFSQFRSRIRMKGKFIPFLYSTIKN